MLLLSAEVGGGARSEGSRRGRAGADEFWATLAQQKQHLAATIASEGRDAEAMLAAMSIACAGALRSVPSTGAVSYLLAAGAWNRQGEQPSTQSPGLASLLVGPPNTS